MVTSNGFEGDSSNSQFGLYGTVSVKSGDARPESFWSESSVFFDKLKKDEIGLTALKRATNKIGQAKIASAKMTMIVENRQVARLFSPLIQAINGSAIQQKNSFLIDKLDQKVASEKLTITDDPFIVSGRGSRLFDSEGLATQKRLIFEKGVLKTYYIDTYYGKKLQMAPTSGSTTNLVFETGDKDLQGLVGTVKRGILVTGFNGGNSNGSTGDFSFGIEGFLIENGAIIQPVSEMNITGNMKELWSNNESSSWLTPSVLFEGVDFSGI
jgi:PmbA protein